MLNIRRIVVGELDTNCYLVYSGERAIIVDPGSEPHKIKAKIEELKLKPRLIIATHCHFDHIMGVDELRDYYKIPFFIHRDEISVLRRQREYILKEFGLDIGRDPALPDDFVSDGDIIEIDDYGLRVMHTPGHSPGSISLVGPDFVLTGDLIFRGGVGRYDLRGSDRRKLIDSLKKIISFPEDTVLFPGHGPRTTVGLEKRDNIFLKELGVL